MSWSGPSRAAAPSRRRLSCARRGGRGARRDLRSIDVGGGGTAAEGEEEREKGYMCRKSSCYCAKVCVSSELFLVRVLVVVIELDLWPLSVLVALSLSLPLSFSLFFSLPPLSNTHKDRYIITSHFSLFLSFLTYLSLFYKSISVFISLSIDT